MPTPIIPMTVSALASRENLLSATQLVTASAMARRSVSRWALDLPQA